MILDYIFYRAYRAYKKKQGSGHFSATAYCSAICVCAFMPLYCLFDVFLRNHQSFRKPVVVFYIILIIAGVFIRYFRKNKLESIFQRYRHSKYNKTIATWLFFLILPLCMIFGVGLTAIIGLYFR
jgi:uncharacterized membrane protein